MAWHQYHATRSLEHIQGALMLQIPDHKLAVISLARVASYHMCPHGVAGLYRNHCAAARFFRAANAPLSCVAAHESIVQLRCTALCTFACRSTYTSALLGKAGMKDLCRLWVVLQFCSPRLYHLTRPGCMPLPHGALTLIVVCKLDLNHMFPPHSHALILLQLIR